MQARVQTHDLLVERRLLRFFIRVSELKVKALKEMVGGYSNDTNLVVLIKKKKLRKVRREMLNQTL